MNNETVVLITGCSTGIGRELSGVLTNKGYTVVATARNIESIDDLQASLKLALDVTKKESIQAAVKEVISRFHKIDILVNNAGYAIRGALEEISEESIKRMFDVNVFGLTNMIKAVVPEMRKKHSGKIINIGSISGKFSQPVNGAYCASKYAIEALSDALHIELYSHNIQVTVIEPGPVQTNFLKTASDNSYALMANPDTCYANLYAAFTSFRNKQKETDPKKVAKDISEILTERWLKSRYEVAVPYSSSMIARFPDPLKEYLLIKSLGISQHDSSNIRS
jgi:NADP-dependent 3-hydroxy acid dehydrogenase YdfG